MFSLFFLPSYLLTRYAASLGQYAAASQSCNFALRFFHSNQKDVSETHWYHGLLLTAWCRVHRLGSQHRVPGAWLFSWQVPVDH
jgi:hypothetical protein